MGNHSQSAGGAGAREPEEDCDEETETEHTFKFAIPRDKIDGDCLKEAICTGKSRSTNAGRVWQYLHSTHVWCLETWTRNSCVRPRGRIDKFSYHWRRKLRVCYSCLRIWSKLQYWPRRRDPTVLRASNPCQQARRNQILMLVMRRCERLWKVYLAMK